MVINVIMLALFVETIVTALKPFWKADGKGLSITEIVSIVIGMVLAISMKMDLFSYICDYEIWDVPHWVHYIFYGMTGIAVGRGPSFIYDAWQALIKWKDIDTDSLLADPLYEDAKKELIEDIKKEMGETTK